MDNRADEDHVMQSKAWMELKLGSNSSWRMVSISMTTEQTPLTDEDRDVAERSD